MVCMESGVKSGYINSQSEICIEHGNGLVYTGGALWALPKMSCEHVSDWSVMSVMSVEL